MADEYRVADTGGLSILCRAAECVDRIAAAQKSISDSGEIILNQYGVPKMNPACVLEKQARDGFYSAMRLLNLETDMQKPDRGLRPWEYR